MTDEEYNMHYRLLTLLGMGTHIILSNGVKKDDKDWWMKAIEAVVYKNQPIPFKD